LAATESIPRTDARAFWTYWAASATSSVGSAVTGVALPLTAVIVLGASEFQMGLLAAAAYVAWLVIGLPAGAVVRALPLRGVQVGMDLARAVAVLSIPLTWWLGSLTLVHLLVVALAISFADVIFFVANATFLPRVVPKEQLQARNSLMSGTLAASQLGGPSLGGLLVQLLGAVPALLADVISYVLSATLLRSLPAVEQPRDETRTPMREQVREGWRLVTRHPVMNPCMWSAAVINFVCGGQMALFAVYLVREVDAKPGLVGLLLSAEGIGSLVGAALCPRLVRQIGSARACLAGGTVAVLGAFLIPLGTGAVAWTLFAVGNIVFAGGAVLFGTTTRTYRQIATPPELLSRVLATVRFVSWGVTPLGGVLGGALGQWLGPRQALVVFAILSVLSPLVLILSPMRRMQDFPDTL
jgi:predicted MFS family arabinose efflux permease